jgi:hypothetical protein
LLRDRTERSAAEPSHAPVAVAAEKAGAEILGAGGRSHRAGTKGEPATRDERQAYDQALDHLNEKRFSEAQREFEAIEAQGGDNAASAALLAAQAVLEQSGCAAAAPRFEDVASRYPGVNAAHEATWNAARCYRDLGQPQRARSHYLTLRSVEGYRKRAQSALDALQTEERKAEAVASRKAAASAPAKAAPAKPAAKAQRKSAPAAGASEEADTQRSVGY